MQVLFPRPATQQLAHSLAQHSEGWPRVWLRAPASLHLVIPRAEHFSQHRQAEAGWEYSQLRWGEGRPLHPVSSLQPPGQLPGLQARVGTAGQREELPQDHAVRPDVGLEGHHPRPGHSSASGAQLSSAQLGLTCS